MEQCPKCGTRSSGGLAKDRQFCIVCGFSLDESEASEPAAALSNPRSASEGSMFIVGWGLIIVGGALMAFGILSSGAPSYSETLNLGLLNDKTNLVIGGGFLFTSGVVCAALESTIRRLGEVINPTVEGSKEVSDGLEKELSRYGV